MRTAYEQGIAEALARFKFAGAMGARVLKPGAPAKFTPPPAPGAVATSATAPKGEAGGTIANGTPLAPAPIGAWQGVKNYGAKQLGHVSGMTDALGGLLMGPHQMGLTNDVMRKALWKHTKGALPTLGAGALALGGGAYLLGRDKEESRWDHFKHVFTG